MSDTKGSDLRLLAKVLPYATDDRRYYIAALLAAPVSASLKVLQPWLLMLVIDDHISVGDLEGVQRVALYYLAAVVLAFAAEASYTLAISYGAMRTITRLRAAVYRHSLALAHSYHDRVPTGRLLTRATSDVEALGETLTAGAMTIVLDVLLVGGVLTAMFALDARMTLLLMLLAPPLALTIEMIRRIMRRLYLAVRTQLAALNSYLAERINGIRVVQLLSDEARTQSQFDVLLYRYRDTTIRTNIWDAVLYALVDGLASICMAMMLWYGSGGLLEGVVTAGLLAAFIDYIGKLFQPIREFSQKLAVIQRAASALEKIFGLLDHDETIPEGSNEIAQPPGSITLKNVRFAYGDGPDVLKGIDLELNPGEVVALVGRTGSGKSTVGKLLTRAYAGYTGSISIGGEEIAGLALSELRNAIGAVNQDVQHFPGSVRFNLALGAQISDAELNDAIRLVHAERFIERLGGLDGRVAHGGANLSVGEGQLLSFARTMAHNAPIVILDEATASVDSLTESRIQDATKAILERKTVLVVAHRLSTIMHADRIAVMEAGKIVELGPHTELMALGGVYATLFQAQFTEHTRAPSAQPA
jgi:ATP-binding cassette subfamily B protein